MKDVFDDRRDSNDFEFEFETFNDDLDAGLMKDGFDVGTFNDVFEVDALNDR
jgi:hypothetical protein